MTCAGCHQPISRRSLYDDYRDQHFCDDDCFERWCESNFEVLAEFYRRMNLNEEES
jgi:hypothetical protein